MRTGKTCIFFSQSVVADWVNKRSVWLFANVSVCSLGPTLRLRPNLKTLPGPNILAKLDAKCELFSIHSYKSRYFAAPTRQPTRSTACRHDGNEETFLKDSCPQEGACAARCFLTLCYDYCIACFVMVVELVLLLLVGPEDKNRLLAAAVLALCLSSSGRSSIKRHDRDRTRVLVFIVAVNLVIVVKICTVSSVPL